MKTTEPNNIDEYIAGFPRPVQKMLEQIRVMVKKLAPEAEEKISYGMPSITLHGRHLVYFAAHKNHIGFYPVPVGNKEFEKLFSGYKTSGRGTIQFPLKKTLPLPLISKLVKFRVKETLEKAKKKKSKNK